MDCYFQENEIGVGAVQQFHVIHSTLENDVFDMNFLSRHVLPRRGPTAALSRRRRPYYYPPPSDMSFKWFSLTYVPPNSPVAQNDG